MGGAKTKMVEANVWTKTLHVVDLVCQCSCIRVWRDGAVTATCRHLELSCSFEPSQPGNQQTKRSAGNVLMRRLQREALAHTPDPSCRCTDQLAFQPPTCPKSQSRRTACLAQVTFNCMQLYTHPHQHSRLSASPSAPFPTPSKPRALRILLQDWKHPESFSCRLFTWLPRQTPGTMSDIEDNERSTPPAHDDSPIDSPAAADNSNDGDAADVDDGMSDHDSDQLSEVDVDDLEDYDPLKANIETRPVEIDEDVAKSLKATKRKRAEGEAAAKKPKEGRRQKKRRTDGDDEVSAADGTIIEGKRRRGGAGGERSSGEKRSKARPSAKATPEPEVDENLTPEQRRARAIEKAMDAAMKGKASKRRTKKDDIVRHGHTQDKLTLDHQILTLPARILKRNSTSSSPMSNSEWKLHARPTMMLPQLASPPSRK